MAVSRISSLQRSISPHLVLEDPPSIFHPEKDRFSLVEPPSFRLHKVGFSNGVPILFKVATADGGVIAEPEFATPKNVAAIPFEIRGGKNLEKFVLSVPELLVSQLAQYLPITVIERIQIQKIFREWKFQLGEAVADEKAVEVGNLQGADTLLMGFITSIQDKLIIHARLVSVKKGEVLASGEIETKKEDLARGTVLLASRLTGSLKKGFDPSKAAQLFPKQNSFEVYAQGLVDEFHEEHTAAAKAFYKAITEDPSFTPAQLAFSSSSVKIAGDELYRRAVEKAMQRNRNILKEMEKLEKLWVAAREFLEEIKNVDQPTVSLMQESKVEEMAVTFSFRVTLSDSAFQKALRRFLEKAGYFVGEYKNEFGTKIHKAFSLEDWSKARVQLGQRLLKAFSLLTSYEYTLVAKKAGGEVLESWSYQPVKPNAHDLEAAGMLCPMVSYLYDARVFALPADPETPLTFFLYFGKGEENRNTIYFRREPDIFKPFSIIFRMDKIKELDTFEIKAKRKWWGGDEILTDEGWRTWLKAFWEQNAIPLPD